MAVVCVDQLVTCPSCGNAMQLSKFRTFKCERCLRELTAEEALTALEMPNAVSLDCVRYLRRRTDL